ncbi:MAG: PEP/pyruvate-binding domain-containing protein [Spirochaetes bacterium]|jgi:hypothetical protein|nr:PEP/pyruvate-binding domain-containing protein [Spirochaetota bacterium]
MQAIVKASTGFESLDATLNDLQLGDNVVWQVESIEDYKIFVSPYILHAIKENRRIIYMRFANHEPLLQKNSSIAVYELNAQSGFELFSKQVFEIIKEMGEEAFYVFDCLSDLLSAWATDLMIGNFFVITCPHLYELRTLAYFAIMRNSHDFKTIARIRETTQVLIDVYNLEGTIYVHPLKVLNRYSPTMFFPHLKKTENFTPITSSADAAGFINHIQKIGVEGSRRNLDFWDRLFLHVEDTVSNSTDAGEKTKMLDQLNRVIIGREERILEIARKNLSLEDFMLINDRMIGTGYIGGKSVGMILSRKILEHDKSGEWDSILEPHDSYYIGSDVFHTYIIQNGWWKLFMEQKTTEGYFSAAEKLRGMMMNGNFPDEIKEQFQQLIEYFGQSPFIVRSSSLLEDAYGNAFAGKYESVFCVNQGSPQKRYQELTQAVRTVYASTMNEDALAYRLQRGLYNMDEQMALLVQRVSGKYRDHYFFPDAAGVGLSYNTYVWNNTMDPGAGMIRIVFGLGTRAVERVEGDYPRIAALDQPMLRPLSSPDEIKKFSQKDVDVLNIRENRIQTLPFMKLRSELPDMDLEKITELDMDALRKMEEMKIDGDRPWVINFDRLLSENRFPESMKRMMKKLESEYRYPVDIEFTLNFTADKSYRINLLQCRPYQARGLQTQVDVPTDIPDSRVFFKTDGSFLGGGISQKIRSIIYVDPLQYGKLPISGKYDVARLIGKLNKMISDRNALPTLLIGPGRWGTTTPSLGVPVRFSEINNISILVEIAQMRDNIMPELSYGTHFFQDLVETDIFYVALFPEKEGASFNRDIMGRYPEVLCALIPECLAYKDTVLVYEIPADGMSIMADISRQKLICFV